MTTVHKKPLYNKQASFLRRLGAWFYDGLIIIAIEMMAAGIVIASLDMLTYLDLFSYGEHLDVSAFLAADPIWSKIYPLYLSAVFIGFFAFFWTKGGQTLGMRAWKLRIQNQNGSNITLTQSFIRMGTSAFGLGNLMALFDRNNSSFQDTWAKCEVIVLAKAN